MKRILNIVAYWILIIPAGITYVIVDSWRSIKRKRHRHHLHRIGRATEHNPFTDKF